VCLSPCMRKCLWRYMLFNLILLSLGCGYFAYTRFFPPTVMPDGPNPRWRRRPPAHACQIFFKADRTGCGDICLGEFTGLCPQSMVLYMGGLKKGSCKGTGFGVHDSDITQETGPCGTLTFKKWIKEEPKQAKIQV
jgi:hypothetical protein